MVQMNIRYDGDLRCLATHGPSTTQMITDAPVDNHGRGESFSPTDLVATALGSCMVTIMGIVANKNSWDIEGTTVEVTKHMVADPVRKIGRIDVRIDVPTNLDVQVQEKLKRAALACPVAETLGDRVDVRLEMNWGS